MKTRILFILLLAVISLPALAQDVDRKKPEAKAFTAEVNFNPFSSSPVAINYLRARYFITEKTAFRMGFSVGMEKQTPQEDVTLKTFEFNIRPG